MGCQTICTRLKPKTGNSIKAGIGLYKQGLRFCKMCDEYIEWKAEWDRCPCCGMPVRTCPRNSKYKKKFKKLVYY